MLANGVVDLLVSALLVVAHSDSGEGEVPQLGQQDWNQDGGGAFFGDAGEHCGQLSVCLFVCGMF